MRRGSNGQTHCRSPLIRSFTRSKAGRVGQSGSRWAERAGREGWGAEGGGIDLKAVYRRHLDGHAGGPAGAPCLESAARGQGAGQGAFKKLNLPRPREEEEEEEEKEKEEEEGGGRGGGAVERGAKVKSCSDNGSMESKKKKNSLTTGTLASEGRIDQLTTID